MREEEEEAFLIFPPPSFMKGIEKIMASCNFCSFLPSFLPSPFFHLTFVVSLGRDRVETSPLRIYLGKVKILYSQRSM